MKTSYKILLDVHLSNHAPNDRLNQVWATIIFLQKSNDIRKPIARFVTQSRIDEPRCAPLRSIERESPDKLGIAVLDQTFYFLCSAEDSEADQVIAEFLVEPSGDMASVALWAFTHVQKRVANLTLQNLTAPGKSE